MTIAYESPADVEDAYYDAIDECDIEKMMSLWEDSSEIACLLPMQPLCRGRGAVEALWKPMLDPRMGVEIMVNHVQWIERGDVAIHIVEERINAPEGGKPQPPIYAVNTFRKSDNGWRLLLHINSPAPPPPGSMPPPMMPGQTR